MNVFFEQIFFLLGSPEKILAKKNLEKNGGEWDTLIQYEIGKKEMGKKGKESIPSVALLSLACYVIIPTA